MKKILTTDPQLRHGARVLCGLSAVREVNFSKFRSLTPALTDNRVGDFFSPFAGISFALSAGNVSGSTTRTTQQWEGVADCAPETGSKLPESHIGRVMRGGSSMLMLGSEGTEAHWDEPFHKDRESIRFHQRNSPLRTETDEMKYSEYLKSEHWKNFKVLKLKSSIKRCCICAALNRIELHHLFYRWPWTDVQVSDVRWLCRTCHQTAHDLMNAKKISFPKPDNHNSCFCILKPAVKKARGFGANTNMFYPKLKQRRGGVER